MTKHFLIKSIRRDKCNGDKESWINYTITPVATALKALPKFVADYNENQNKQIAYSVYGVKGQEEAVITISGPRARVKYFPTALADTNFYEYFSLREVEYPEIYI